MDRTLSCHRLQLDGSSFMMRRCHDITFSFPASDFMDPSNPDVFQLQQPFLPAGDQPQAIDSLTKGFQEGRSTQVLLGATGTGKTYTMANVIANLGRPALVLSHNKTLAAQLYSEFKEFSLKMLFTISSVITTTTSQKRTFRNVMFTSRRMPRLTKKLIACGWLPQVRLSADAMSSLLHQ